MGYDSKVQAACRCKCAPGADSLIPLAACTPQGDSPGAGSTWCPVQCTAVCRRRRRGRLRPARPGTAGAPAAAWWTPPAPGAPGRTPPPAPRRVSYCATARDDAAIPIVLIPTCQGSCRARRRLRFQVGHRHLQPHEHRCQITRVAAASRRRGALTGRISAAQGCSPQKHKPGGTRAPGRARTEGRPAIRLTGVVCCKVPGLSKYAARTLHLKT